MLSAEKQYVAYRLPYRIELLHVEVDPLLSRECIRSISYTDTKGGLLIHASDYNQAVNRLLIR